MSAPRRQAEPAFRHNEFLDTLSRIKRDQPRRYAREVAPGTQVQVSFYEKRKRQHEEREAAR